MDFITYNIKKRFSFMPSIIQVTIFVFASAFMIGYNTLFIDIEVRNWINNLEEAIFWFFLIFPFLCFILLSIRMFSYDLPSKKGFYIHKALFAGGQLIMFTMALVTSIIFFKADAIDLGHGARDGFYKDFIASVLLVMALMALFASFPVLILKSPYLDNEKTEDKNA